MKVALVCIARWEENYIDEWIRYNKLLNFDKIFIYDNGNEWKRDSLVFTDPDVVLVNWEGDGQAVDDVPPAPPENSVPVNQSQNNWRQERHNRNRRRGVGSPESKLKSTNLNKTNNKQVRAYNHFLNNNRKTMEYDWIAFLDCDEFLVLKKHETIQDFIEEHNFEKDAIGIYTYIFGDNGLHGVENGNYSVLERFTMRRERHFPAKERHGISKTPAFFIKSIVRNTPHIKMLSSHTANIPSVGTSGDLILCDTGKLTSWTHYGIRDVAQINHYFGKTAEEFHKKIERGRATSGRKRTMDEFYHHNINEVEDTDALEFYLKNYWVNYDYEI